MKFSEIIKPGHVALDLQAGPKEAVLRALLGIVAGDLAGGEAEGIYEALLSREATMSTAILPEVAIPHAVVASVASPVVALGICRGGTDYASLDGAATKVFFLLLSPANPPNSHLMVLASLATLMQSAGIIADLEGARNEAEILAAIASHEA
ncbi:MAG: PTS sugar transporter subunit IIA [Candidatus Sumerlaeaceae bacterium]|nr:PTS sugar transporter subunit IIA [Candidatus Sumerlaeaceae bacterium]